MRPRADELETEPWQKGRWRRGGGGLARPGVGRRVWRRGGRGRTRRWGRDACARWTPHRARSGRGVDRGQGWADGDGGWDGSWQPSCGSHMLRSSTDVRAPSVRGSRATREAWSLEAWADGIWASPGALVRWALGARSSSDGRRRVCLADGSTLITCWPHHLRLKPLLAATHAALCAQHGGFTSAPELRAREPPRRNQQVPSSTTGLLTASAPRRHALSSTISRIIPHPYKTRSRFRHRPSNPPLGCTLPSGRATSC